MAEKKTIELDIQSNLGSLRSQLREAQAEVAAMADKFGATSQEAANAAKKAAELKDKIGDAKNLTDAFNPDAKFNALSQSIGGALNGFQAVEGAFGIMGVESEQLQATLLKVQSAMALSQGIQGLMEAKDSFKNLTSVVKTSFNEMTTAGKTFAVTGIGLLITGIGLLIANWDKVSVAMGKTNATQEAYNDTLGDYKKAAADVIQKTSQVKSSFELARSGVISKEEALQNYNNTLGDTFGRAKDLDEAEMLYAKKTDAYIKSTALRAQAQALFAKAAEAAAKGTTAELEDQTTFFDKLYAGAANNLMGFTVSTDILNKKQKQRVKETKENATKEQKALEKLATDLLKQAETVEKTNDLNVKSTLKSTKTNTKTKVDGTKDALEGIKALEEEYRVSQLSEQEQEIDAIKKKYQAQYDEAAKYKLDVTKLKENETSELAAIDKKYRDLEMKEMNDLRIVVGDEAKESLKTMIDTRQKELQIQVETNFAKRKLSEEEIKKKKEDEEKKKQIQIQGAKDTLSMLSNLTTLFAGKSKQAQEKAFKVQKAINIANAVVDTYKAANQALASAPPPFNFIAMGAAITAGLVNVKKITDTKFEGGATPSAGGGGGTSGAGASPSIMSPSFNVVGNSGLNQLAQLQQQPMKAYVVSGDVTSAQSLDRNRIENATLVQ